MSHCYRIGGVIHTYQKYDPRAFPSPTQPPPDVVSPLFDHLMMYGGSRQLTDEELARAVRIDPSQIAGLGPSLDALMALLLERKRKILEKYETDTVQQTARENYYREAARLKAPRRVAERFGHAVRSEQIHDLERLWYAQDDERSPFARRLVRLIETLGEKYQVDELAAKYAFTGRTPLTVPEALEILAELKKIDELLKQLEQARETAQIAVIDMDSLAEFTEPGDMEGLQRLQQMVEDYIREAAEQQGLAREGGAYQLTPQAYKLFQGKLLDRIFSELQPSRTGRHQGPVLGEGAVELQQTKPYEFGDSVAQMDIPQTMINAMVRSGAGLPLRLKSEDIEVHRTRNTPKCATVVIMDMSGSMRYDAQYMNVKRMALALNGLIRTEYPGDYLHFVEMYSFAKPCRSGEIIDLLPKPVMLYDPVIRFRVDMSRDDISEFQIPPHFTNIQRSLQLARQCLAAQDTPNRQIILITDGLPTAHFDGSWLYLLYPPDPLTETATLREGKLCQREGITINMFLVPSWSQSQEDIRFAYRLAESTSGRVFFTAGGDLDRYVVWDYVSHKREIVASTRFRFRSCCTSAASRSSYGRVTRLSESLRSRLGEWCRAAHAHETNLGTCKMKPLPTIALACTLCCVLWPGLASGASAAEDEASNAVRNASFEQAADDQPAEWSTSSWGGSGSFDYADQGRSGARSVAISSTDGADIGWQQQVAVDPHATYRLSGWIKTQDVQAASGDARRGRGALLNVHNIQPTATRAVTGTRDWTQVDVVFETGVHETVQINCLFGGWGLVTGQAWFDDIRLELLSREDWKPALAIDVTQTGEPISKYIYGQFIEHLGRCIYGGIWAEMLEDRKFYFPITADYDPYRPGQGVAADALLPVVGASPWEILGCGNTVRMVQEDSFVGEHTPRIDVGSGIRQNDLATIAGKAYEGTIWLRAAGEADARVSITLGSQRAEPLVATAGQPYQKFPFRLTADQTTDRASLAISVGGGPCLVGTVSLMPADNVSGMRADTLELLRQLNSPVYRWPGGNFVSGYDWRDGVGDRDRRPPRKNPAWTGVEHNDFGLDEFMTFCRILNTEPYIAVNSGLGGVENAVAELQYANGAADTPLGKRRAENGHPEPYGVRWWGIGNEMYGGWQLGHMPLEQYIQKHNRFAEALRAEDPSIQLVAVGATGRWSEGMMQHCADHMDLISEHFYRRDQAGLAAHVQQMPESVRQKAEAHREYRRRLDSLQGKDIDIALDEWNYWYGPYEFGELGTRYFLKDALGVAAALHEYARQSDIMFMANYAQTVNVIGCIKTTKTEAAFATTGLPLKLYRNHFGVLPVQASAQSPLDVAAALSEDGRTLTIGIVNPTMTELELPLTVTGCQLTGQGERWQIAGQDPMAYNEPGKPARVEIEHIGVDGVQDALPVAACSVTLYALPLDE
jgi:alpha-L-arabinofuranosidase